VKKVTVLFCSPDVVPVVVETFQGDGAREAAWAHRRRLSIWGVRGGWYDLKEEDVPWRCDCGSACRPGQCINRPA
jgi:hypothetical protein